MITFIFSNDLSIFCFTIADLIDRVGKYLLIVTCLLLTLLNCKKFKNIFCQSKAMENYQDNFVF